VSGAPAEIQLSIGDQVRTVKVSQNDWSEVKIGTFSLAQGQNRLKLLVKTGAVDMDWLDVNLAKDNQQSAGLGVVPLPH